MKRVLGVLAGACLAISFGCAQSYDLRVEETIKNMKYRQNLDKNTEPPPKSDLEKEKIYIRAPKGLIGPAKTFAYVVEPKKFDIAYTFINQDNQVSLHILARSNAPKAPAAKKAAPKAPAAEPPPAAVRGDFAADVLEFINSTYSTELNASQLKPVELNAHGRKSVSYKGATIDPGSKQVKVYFHGDKNSPAQVALIFEGSKEALRNLSSQIDYSLNSLVVGPKATNYYNGQDEFADDASAAPTGVF